MPTTPPTLPPIRLPPVGPPPAAIRRRALSAATETLSVSAPIVITTSCATSASNSVETVLNPCSTNSARRRPVSTRHREAAVGVGDRRSHQLAGRVVDTHGDTRKRRAARVRDTPSGASGDQRFRVRLRAEHEPAGQRHLRTPCVEGLRQWLDERLRRASDQRQLHVGPVVTDRVVDHRPPLQSRLCRGLARKDDAVRGLPDRYLADVADI